MRRNTQRPDEWTLSSVVLLTEIRDELRKLNADRAAVRRRPSRTGLLAAISATVGDYCFTSAELLEHAEVNERLAAALDAAQINSAKTLGKALRVLRGREIDGRRLERLRVEHDGVVWRVSEV